MKKTQSRFLRAARFDKTPLLFRLIFTYVFPTFWRGMRNNGLQMDDIDRCPKLDESEIVTRKLKANWELAKKRSAHPKFAWVLFKTFASDYTFPFCVYVFEECVLRIAQPLLLGQVIRYFSIADSGITHKWACVYALGVCLCTFFFVSMHHPTMQQVMRLGMRLRTASCALMYQKALKLSRASVGQTAASTVINIMANDVNRIDEFSIFASYLIVAPIQTAMIVYIVWTYLELACLAGIGLLLLFIPFQALMGRLFSGVRLRTALLTDSRLKFMSEIINGMRVIKMYAWETPFADRVADARRAEVSQVKRGLFLKAINLSMFFVASRIILFVCFVLYVLVIGKLTAEAVFVSMALFNTLRLILTFMFPSAISQASELKITCGRIEKFLLLEEMPEDKSKKNNESFSKDKGSSVVVNNITAKWNQEVFRPTLKDVSVRLKQGDLLAVIGAVGSGKSSFLMTLLNELPVENGRIDVEGSLAYASQDAWSFQDSVRNNILFGEDYDDKRYQKIVEVCALERDLQLMPFGDRTLVGEKGVSLSGGQRARINLARAVYRNADILLLDDPLSAVDTSVAEHIFEKCILEHLKEKIRILVTHQVQFIEKATKILVLKEGQVFAFGSFNELQQMGIDFMSLLSEPEVPPESEGDNLTTKNRATSMLSLERSISVQSVSSDALKGRTRTLSSAKATESFEVQDPEGDDDHEGELLDDKSQEIQKVEEEKFQRGSIKGRIYKEYLKAGSGPVMFIAMIFFTVASQVLFHGSDLFLTYWTDNNQKNDTVIDKDVQRNDIIIYSSLVGALFVTTVLRSVTFFVICMTASVNLHNKIFARLLRAKTAFFDSNPAGRILNRFTKDLGIIDENLPTTAYDLNLTIGQAIGVIVTVSIVNYYLVLPAIVLAALIIYIRGIYIKSARDIKRYEGLARSPVYSHVSTTINGLASIRAYGAQEQFERTFYSYQNDHSATWFIFISSSRAMGLMMDWISTSYICIITLVVMLSDQIQGGEAGLAISSGLMLAGMTQWGVRQSAEFESQMTSVERIVEYQDLEKEAPAESEPKLKPFPEWPDKGKIDFDHMSLTYAGSDKPVLRNLTCTIEGGEKIGIVGRTGAGKSSMIAALFRLTEPTGVIRIDGIEIQSIGLNDLRKKISIIPQDPVIFSGSIRYNLDPFSEYPDCDLWSALEKVQLKSQVENYTGKLDAKLSDSGSNLSVGQRQLICLARAILRRSPILILDEATASTDFETDALIQATIRTEFASNTVITIAHRLNTIIDNSRVLVLDAGEILEFDRPYSLLKSKGAFYEMVKKTGPSMFTHLYQIAKKMHEKKEDQAKLVALSDTESSSLNDDDDEEYTEEEVEKKKNGIINLGDRLSK